MEQLHTSTSASGAMPGQCRGYDAVTEDHWSEIAGRIKIGDKGSFDALYEAIRRYYTVYFARKIGLDSAQDATHELFIRTVNAVKNGSVREPQRLMAFIGGIARNQVLEYFRGSERKRRDPDPKPSDEPRDFRWSSENVVLDQERQNFIQSCLADLPPNRREILTRFYLLEQTQDKILCEMKLTKDQFRLLKSRAKMQFGLIGRRRMRGNKVRMEH